MENEDADNDSPDSSDASPDRVSDAYWDGLSCFRQKHGTQNIEECEACYPSPEFCPDSQLGLSETESEGGFAEAGNYEDYPIHILTDIYCIYFLLHYFLNSQWSRFFNAAAESLGAISASHVPVGVFRKTFGMAEKSDLPSCPSSHNCG